MDEMDTPGRGSERDARHPDADHTLPVKTRAQFAKRRRNVLKRHPEGARKEKRKARCSQRRTRWRPLTFVRESPDGTLTASGFRGVGRLLVTRLELAEVGYELRPLAPELAAACDAYHSLGIAWASAGFLLPPDLDAPGVAGYALALAMRIRGAIEILRACVLPKHRRKIRKLSDDLDLGCVRAIEDPWQFLAHLADFASLGPAPNPHPAFVRFNETLQSLACGVHLQLVCRAAAVQRFAAGTVADEEYILWQIEPDAGGDIVTITATPSQWTAIKAQTTYYQDACCRLIKEFGAEREGQPHSADVITDPVERVTSVQAQNRLYYIAPLGTFSGRHQT